MTVSRWALSVFRSALPVDRLNRMSTSKHSLSELYIDMCYLSRDWHILFIDILASHTNRYLSSIDTQNQSIDGVLPVDRWAVPVCRKWNHQQTGSSWLSPSPFCIFFETFCGWAVPICRQVLWLHQLCFFIIHISYIQLSTLCVNLILKELPAFPASFFCSL